MSHQHRVAQLTADGYCYRVLLLAAGGKSSDEDDQQENMEVTMASGPDNVNAKAHRNMPTKQQEQDTQNGSSDTHMAAGEHSNTKKRRAVLYDSDDE